MEDTRSLMTTTLKVPTLNVVLLILIITMWFNVNMGTVHYLVRHVGPRSPWMVVLFVEAVPLFAAFWYVRQHSKMARFVICAVGTCYLVGEILLST